LARHRLTARERREGVLKALRSRRTPPQLKRGLRRYARRMGWI
jgi:hypothetical protein